MLYNRLEVIGGVSPERAHKLAQRLGLNSYNHNTNLKQGRQRCLYDCFILLLLIWGFSGVD